MLELATILAAIAAAMLVFAVGAWLRLWRGPELQRANGRGGRNVENVERASQLLVVAVGVSVFASLVAMIGIATT